MVAILTRTFGFDHLEVAEDAMQDAILIAMLSWGLGGVPRGISVPCLNEWQRTEPGHRPA